MPLMAIRQANDDDAALSQRQLQFDYDLLGARKEEAVENTYRILADLKTMAQSAYDIGAKLVEQKDVVGHGFWLKWLKDELGWSERSAQMLMAIPSRWSREEYAVFAVLPQTAQARLAASGTPDEAVEIVRDILTRDEGRMTVGQVDQIIATTKTDLKLKSAPRLVTPARRLLNYDETLALLDSAVSGRSDEDRYRTLIRARPADFAAFLPTDAAFDHETFMVSRSTLVSRMDERTYATVRHTNGDSFVTANRPVRVVVEIEEEDGEDAENEENTGVVRAVVLRLEAIRAMMDGETGIVFDLLLDAVSEGHLPPQITDSWVATVRAFEAFVAEVTC